MKNSTTLHLTIVLLLAFLLRCGAAAYWQSTAQAEGRLFRLGDSHSYWTLASHLAHGRPYQYGSEHARIFRAPLYPLILAPLTRINDERTAVWWARILGCGIGTLTVALIFLLAKRMAGSCAGLSTAALAAVYPSAIGMSVCILSEVLLLPLMIAHLLLWQSAWRAACKRTAFRYAILAGCIAGACVLARPSWLLFAPFAFGLGMLLGSRRSRHALVFFGTVLGLSCIMSPWWIRNASITGRFVPTTLQVGPSLYDGWHAGATGASDEGMDFMQSLFAEQLQADRQHPEQRVSTLEYRVNQRAQTAALHWARHHPLEVIRLAGRKFMRTWSLWPDGGDVSSIPIRLGITLSSIAVLMLAIYAHVGVIRRFDWFYGICWLPCIYFTLLHMVFVGSVRYREPAVFVLIALAGCAIAKLFRCPLTCVALDAMDERVPERASISRT